MKGKTFVASNVGGGFFHLTMERRWQECANSGHSATACRTGQIDPLLPFKIDRMNRREARESGLFLADGVGCVVLGHEKLNSAYRLEP